MSERYVDHVRVIATYCICITRLWTILERPHCTADYKGYCLLGFNKSFIAVDTKLFDVELENETTVFNTALLILDV